MTSEEFIMKHRQVMNEAMGGKQIPFGDIIVELSMSLYRVQIFQSLPKKLLPVVQRFCNIGTKRLMAA